MEETEGSSATTEEAKAQDKLEEPSKPWHSYISEELPRSLMDSRYSAIRSARSLQQNSSTHLSSLQDFMLDIRSKYAVYEDAFFTKVKDAVTIARQHPTITAGSGLSAAFLLMGGGDQLGHKVHGVWGIRVQRGRIEPIDHKQGIKMKLFCDGTAPSESFSS